MSWTGIVKVLRQTREVRSTPPGLGIAKNSHSRISFCEEEVFLSDTLGEGFGSGKSRNTWPPISTFPCSDAGTPR